MSMIGPGCLLFTGLFTWILGLASIGLWIGCYFECPSGRDTEFNYYVAVWTGVVAFLTGLFHMAFCCGGQRRQINSIVLWLAALFSFILLPCSLLLVTLSGYLSWREWDTEQKYQAELANLGPEETPPLKLPGDYVTGIALFAVMAVVGALLLVLTLIFNCYHCCGNSEIDEEEVEISVEPTEHEDNPNGQIKSKAAYHQEFYNPPPPTYAREHTGNTQRGRPVYNAHYNDTRRTRDTYHNINNTSRSRDHRYGYNSSSGTESRTEYGRSGGYHYSSRPRAPPPASYSHPPAENYSSRRVYNPSHVRYGVSSSNQVRRDNPWSFGPREDIIGSTRSHQSNYF